MHWLELKIPPVVVFLLAFGLMHGLAHLLPLFTVSLPLPLLVAALCFILSGLFGLAGLYQFKKERTTVHPQQMEKTSKLVHQGIYRYSRNPMYVGLLLLLIADGYRLQNMLSLAVCWLFVWYMNRFQIVPEELYLEQRFGEQYRRYRQKVRRWV